MKIGIDVGGSHVALGIIDNNKLICKKEQDYLFYNEDMSEIVLETIIELIYKTINQYKIEKKDIDLIGVTFPGTVSNGVVIKAENLGIENLKKKLKKNSIQKFYCKMMQKVQQKLKKNMEA